MPPIAVGVNTLSKSGSEELKGDVTLSAGALMGLTQSAQDIQAALTFAVASRIAARKTAGAGAGEESTLSEILDFIGSAAQGDILYRDASAWARLGAGTSGQFLKTQGAAANPIWATGGGSWTRLATATASASATINFTGLTSAYVAYVVVLTAVAPATDNVELWLRTSTDGGSTYDAGVSDYRWGSIVANAEAASILATGDAADSEIRLMDAQGNAANEKLSGEVWIHNPSAADYCRVRYKMLGQSTESNTRPTFGGGHRIAAADVDAIRFLFSSGNISSGQFDLFGLAA